MDTPNSELEFHILLDEIINRDPQPELNPAKIRFYGAIVYALELVGDWVVWLN